MNDAWNSWWLGSLVLHIVSVLVWTHPYDLNFGTNLLLIYQRATDESKNHDIGMSANRLSEEMVKCISAIYCQLADPPLLNHGCLSSPSDSSPRDQFVMWSPQCEGETKWVHNDSEASMDFSESCFGVVEVHSICKNSKRSSNVEQKERIFRWVLETLWVFNANPLRFHV